MLHTDLQIKVCCCSYSLRPMFTEPSNNYTLHLRLADRVTSLVKENQRKEAIGPRLQTKPWISRILGVFTLQSLQNCQTSFHGCLQKRVQFIPLPGCLYFFSLINIFPPTILSIFKMHFFRLTRFLG